MNPIKRLMTRAEAHAQKQGQENIVCQVKDGQGGDVYSGAEKTGLDRTS